MLFNSYEFIFLFLPCALLGYFAIARIGRRAAIAWLALASIVFYGYWNPKFVSLLLASICLNYGFGHLIENQDKLRRKKQLLASAIFVNLCVLAVYKYANFFVETFNSLSGTSLHGLDIALPLGVSFFTFTQITYLVDTYRKHVREHDFLNYFLFVTYFPHLIAGPLLHHGNMMPQFRDAAIFLPRASNLVIGLAIFSTGLAKKVLLADSFAVHATPVFDAAASGAVLSPRDAWLGSINYTLQLYFDFSGYSDMAIGLSKLFNIDIPINFESPYKARNIAEFWRRWHISLSTFLRDYLYIPLGGNRHGDLRRHANLMITMLLGGLWHGAGGTFVLWGGLHGLYLVVYHFWAARFPASVRCSRWPRRMTGCLITFFFVILAWVMFRANTVDAALAIYRGMFDLNGKPPSVNIGGYNLWFNILLLTGLGLVWFAPNTQTLFLAGSMARPANLAWRWPLLTAAATGTLFLVCLYTIGTQKVSEFIYFQF